MDTILFNYDFITCNPSAEVIDKMHQAGIRPRKIQDGIWYISKSFIEHSEALSLCKELGLAVQRFKKVKLNSPEI